MAELRDRRIARAMITALAENWTQTSLPTIEFCCMDDPFEFMNDICKDAGWEPSSTPAMQRVLRAVALRLYRERVLDRGRLSNGELEYRESPRWQYSYSLTNRCISDINPGRWGRGGAWERSEVKTHVIEAILDDIWPATAQENHPC